MLLITLNQLHLFTQIILSNNPVSNKDLTEYLIQKMSPDNKTIHTRIIKLLRLKDITIWKIFFIMHNVEYLILNKLGGGT